MFKFITFWSFIRASAYELSPRVVVPVKLPVWPIWSGVAAQMADWLRLPTVSNFIVNNLGGRVVPMQLVGENTSPFLLLVHHSHSFCNLDPIRYLSSLVLPEGFPAHPHAGFDTVTYCIEGGMAHRHSDGVSMRYGDGDVQWMRAGSGIIHEEMWDLSHLKDNRASSTEWWNWQKWFRRIEIYQLWINLPKCRKSDPPSVHVLRARDIPDIITAAGARVKLLAGAMDKSAGGNVFTLRMRSPDNMDKGSSAAESRSVRWSAEGLSASPVSILHLILPPNCRVAFEIDAPEGEQTSCLLYVRRGSVRYDGSDSQYARQERLLVYEAERGTEASNPANAGDRHGGSRPLSPDNSPTTSARETWTIRNVKGERGMTINAGENGLDALLLVGIQLLEPVLWEGPFVQADAASLAQCKERFQSLPADAYWDHRLSDAGWDAHVAGISTVER